MGQSHAINDKLLAGFSRGLFQDESRFINKRIFPEVKSKNLTGKLGSYGKESLRIVNSVMGGRGKARQIHVETTSSDTFIIENHGLSDIITKEDYANYDLPFDIESIRTRQLKTMLMLAREKAMADIINSTSIMTKNTTLSGESQWSDYTNSDPIGDIQTAQASIYDNGGENPAECIAIMGWHVKNKLRYHPQILENLGFSRARAGLMSNAELASALDVSEVLVGTAMYNSSDLGQTDSLSPVWGKHFVLAYSPKVASLEENYLGVTVVPASNAEIVQKTPKSNPPMSKELVHTMDYDMVLTDANLGYLAKDVVA